MISPTDATIIDSRDAYPIDECVAKMIGWMQGSERLEKIKLDERGILPEVMPHISRLVYSLEKHLEQLKERARLELFDAADAYGDAVDGTPEKDSLGNIIDQKYLVINEYSKLNEKAQFYKSEIRRELAKDKESQLKVDRIEKDDGADIIYITLDSLDDWAKKFKVNIIEVPESISVAKKSQRDNALSLVINDILRINPTAKPAKVLAELRKLIGVKNSIIIDISDEGVKWLNEENNAKFTSIDSLGERIRYWKKHRLNQD